MAVPDLQVVVARTTCDTIELFWAQYPGEGVIYGILIEPGPVDRMFSVRTDYVFMDLDAATEYTITVSAIISGNTTDYTPVVQKTRMYQQNTLLWNEEFRQLRARRALALFTDVPLRTRRAVSLYNVYGVSALLVLNETSLSSVTNLFALTWWF